MSSARQIEVSILSNEEIMPGAHLVRVLTNGAVSARAGQFLMVSCDQNHERLLRRPLSVHGLSSDRVSFLFKVVGTGTDWLARRKPGEALNLLGPLGNGFRIEPAWRRLLLVAGGLGVAPLALLAEEALASGCKVTLLLGASEADQLYPARLIPDGVKIVLATDDGSAGQCGVVCDLIPDYATGIDAVFACGPVSMYKALSRLAPAILPGKPVQVSVETRMACGLGACLGCSIKTGNGMRLVCHDGPVFDLGEVDWDWLACC